MKKNKNSGFMLIETLLVSTFVLGVLTYLFVQFSALKRSYDDSFRYDTVPGLYGVKNINQYITRQNTYSNMRSVITNEGYTEFSCALYGGYTCDELMDSLEIDKTYLVKDNVIKNNINTDVIIFTNDDELYRFTKKIVFSSEDNAYHLVVKYSDNTFATMAITL